MLKAPDDHNLDYMHKESGKKYLVKRVTSLHYRIFDPETGSVAPITKFRLMKNFRSCAVKKMMKKRAG